MLAEYGVTYRGQTYRRFSSRPLKVLVLGQVGRRLVPLRWCVSMTAAQASRYGEAPGVKYKGLYLVRGVTKITKQ